MLIYLISSEHAAQKFEGFFSGPLKALELHDDVESKTYQQIWGMHIIF